MKIIKNNNNRIAIKAATSTGTIYYQVALEDAIDALKDNKGNIFVIHELEKLGWDAIDLKSNLFGSAIIDDNLYICTTDGQDILINGDLVDPEEALNDYDIDQLSAYIEPATDDIIVKHITGYEVTVSDVDDSALELLKQGITFIDLVKAAEDLNIVD